MWKEYILYNSNSETFTEDKTMEVVKRWGWWEGEEGIVRGTSDF